MKDITQKTYKAFYLFAGIGGGALGFQQAKDEYRSIEGQFVTLAGVDSDPEACEDFRNITGSKCEQMDLFSREQYKAFHGQEPPSDWKEVTPEMLREVAGDYPDVVFSSPPCKGFSGLLSEKKSKTKKYQALNELTIRGIDLTLTAFKDDLPALILLENVPRITTRGANLLNKIKQKLELFGYVLNDAYHDCGEIGNLAQSRKRYLLIARNPAKLDSFVYEPPKYSLRTIGEVLETLPLPNDSRYGKIHELPKLQWKTWIRLALIEAGGDWSSLEGIKPNKYSLVDSYGEIVQYLNMKQIPKAVYCIQKDDHVLITGGIEDPRLNCSPRKGTFGVMKWDESAKTIIGSLDVHAGCAAVADPRIPSHEEGFAVVSLDGTFHRPLTTLELAVLQGFPLTLADGSPFKLAGNSDARFRERIGNAIPVQAATAIAKTMLQTLLAAEKGDWLMSGEKIWVSPSIEDSQQIVA